MRRTENGTGTRTTARGLLAAAKLALLLAVWPVGGASTPVELAGSVQAVRVTLASREEEGSLR